jgi:hypothetical protein
MFYLQTYPATSNTGYGTGDMSSTSLSSPWCSLRPRTDPKVPATRGVFGNHSSALVQLVIETQSWPGWLAYMRSKTTAHRFGMPGPFLNRTGGLSIGKCDCFMNSPCFRWCNTLALSWGLLSAPRSGSCGFFVWWLSDLWPQHLCTLATNRFARVWGVSFYADHIRALTESLDWKLAGAENCLVPETGKERVPTKGWPNSAWSVS